VSTGSLALAQRLLAEAVEALAAAAGSRAGDAELVGVLTLAEGARRRIDRLTLGALANLQRRGTFAERGYRNPAAALGDLLGWERADARRHLTAAEHAKPRIGLDGTPLPPRLPATAAALDAGTATLRHVEVVVHVLGSDAAGRLTPERWAAAEAQLASWIPDCTPHELQVRGAQLVDVLDADGAEPDDRPKPQTNELFLTRHPDGSGGTLRGRFDGAALFDAVASAIDAHARPCVADDDRTPAQRQAEALADVCGYVLDHADVPACGGRRPHLNVLVRLEDLQNRARAACLEFGGTLSPESLRLLCCDAAVIPIVLDGRGQPLDVGRLTRVIPDGIRRSVTARDRGCARCGKPPSWCEIHHVRKWENGGPTSIDNCVMVCRACHRLVHHAGWDVKLVNGLPEFYPPPWIDPRRRARRRPPPVLAPTG
jgi:Domain of unknown function (DUF222)/HNH endonuclease